MPSAAANEPIVIKMLSRADTVKGQGVMSAYDELRALLSDLPPDFTIIEDFALPCDILHIHTLNPTFYMNNFARDNATISVCSVHFLPETVEGSIDIPAPLRTAFYEYVMSFYKNCDLLVTVNPYFIDKLAELGVERERVSYIPNFVDRKGFSPVESDAKKRALRKAWKLPEDRFTVLSVGQLQTRKGVLDFVQVAKALPQMEFVWAGGFSFGRLTDGYEELQQLTENPPANVHFLGIVERERMGELYNLADVLFQPSYEELFPMTMLEAMSCGLPMLARDLELYKGVLEDYFIPGTSNEEFKDALQRLSADPVFWTEGARRSAAGNAFYSRERVLGEWERFYRKAARMARRKQGKGWAGLLP